MGGAGPIPLTEIEAYCRLFGINDFEEREKFVTMIRALDNTYVVKTAEKREAERSKNGRRRN